MWTKIFHCLKTLWWLKSAKPGTPGYRWKWCYAKTTSHCEGCATPIKIEAWILESPNGKAHHVVALSRFRGWVSYMQRSAN